MAINKQLILDAISQALDGMGMTDMGGDEYDEEGAMEGDNSVPIWSQLDAGTLGQGSGPIHNKDDLLGINRTSKPPMVDAYGMPAAGDQEEMMTAMGLV